MAQALASYKPGNGTEIVTVINSKDENKWNISSWNTLQ